MILLIAGNGMLGSDVKKKLEKENHQFVCYNSDVLDITDLEMCKNLISDKFDIVINCAAYTYVDNAEEDLVNAYNINSIGPKNIAQCCAITNAKLIHISTDYVFDGLQESYAEYDLCNPKTVYGKTKLLGENYVRQYCNNYFILRTAWLFGSGGSNFIKTMLSIKDKNEIKVVGDQYGQPTYTNDLVDIIIKLMQTEYYGIYHVSSTGMTSWYEFAKYIFEKTNSDVNLVSCSSNEFISLAKRPKHSVFRHHGLEVVRLNTMPNWKEAVDRYLVAEGLV